MFAQVCLSEYRSVVNIVDIGTTSCVPSEDQSLLCAQWLAKDPSFLHADIEDSDQTGRMPKLICLLWTHVILLVLSWLHYYKYKEKDT